VKSRFIYCNDLDISVAPAFRYQKAIDHESKEIKKKKVVIIALPMLFSESRRLLDLVLRANLDSDTEFLVKRHPTVTMSKLMRNVEQANNARLKFTEKNLVDLMDESRLFITMTSSAAIEAILCNTDVAIIANQSQPTANPLGGIVDPEYWSICHTSEDIVKAFNSSLKNRLLDNNEYLVPLTEKTLSDFIDG